MSAWGLAGGDCAPADKSGGVASKPDKIKEYTKIRGKRMFDAVARVRPQWLKDNTDTHTRAKAFGAQWPIAL